MTSIAATRRRLAWLWLCTAMASLLALGASKQPESGADAAPPVASIEPEAAPEAAASIRFLAFDLFVDPRGRPLAAYQIEVNAGDGAIVTLVGVEGGDGAYAAAPYYDPAALHAEAAEAGEPPARSDRLVLAALAGVGEVNAGAVIAAPTADSRVARLHYMVEGDGAPALSARLIVAGVDEHTPIDAAIRLVPVVIEEP